MSAHNQTEKIFEHAQSYIHAAQVVTAHFLYHHFTRQTPSIAHTAPAVSKLLSQALELGMKAHLWQKGTPKEVLAEYGADLNRLFEAVKQSGFLHVPGDQTMLATASAYIEHRFDDAAPITAPDVAWAEGFLDRLKESDQSAA